MWRGLGLSVALVGFAQLSSLAGEPGAVVVVVPDPATAAIVAASMPGARISVLQVHGDDSDETINARAIALRDASLLVFDQSKESLRLAMFRERLQMQGMVAINIRPASGPRHPKMRPANAPPLERLAYLPAQLSPDRR